MSHQNWQARQCYTAHSSAKLPLLWVGPSPLSTLLYSIFDRRAESLSSATELKNPCRIGYSSECCVHLARQPRRWRIRANAHVPAQLRCLWPRRLQHLKSLAACVRQKTSRSFPTLLKSRAQTFLAAEGLFPWHSHAEEHSLRCSLESIWSSLLPSYSVSSKSPLTESMQSARRGLACPEEGLLTAARFQMVVTFCDDLEGGWPDAVVLSVELPQKRRAPDLAAGHAPLLAKNLHSTPSCLAQISLG